MVRTGGATEQCKPEKQEEGESGRSHGRLTEGVYDGKGVWRCCVHGWQTADKNKKTETLRRILSAHVANGGGFTTVQPSGVGLVSPF